VAQVVSSSSNNPAGLGKYLIGVKICLTDSTQEDTPSAFTDDNKRHNAGSQQLLQQPRRVATAWDRELSLHTAVCPGTAARSFWYFCSSLLPSPLSLSTEEKTNNTNAKSLILIVYTFLSFILGLKESKNVIIK